MENTAKSLRPSIVSLLKLQVTVCRLMKELRLVDYLSPQGWIKIRGMSTFLYLKGKDITYTELKKYFVTFFLICVFLFFILECNRLNFTVFYDVIYL